ncbi:hypothetical protein DFH27DRAFT_638239 [Peziza echinospora]|nr:hypothetical protein DFH27DRAFT_638239 [Peziza echinospora]
MYTGNWSNPYVPYGGGNPVTVSEAPASESEAEDVVYPHQAASQYDQSEVGSLYSHIPPSQMDRSTVIPPTNVGGYTNPGGLPTGGHGPMSFSTPFHERGPQFYMWRNEVIDQGNSLMDSLPAEQKHLLVRAAHAHRDMVWESAHHVEKRAEKWRIQCEKAKLDSEAHKVAVMQLQARVAELEAEGHPSRSGPGMPPLTSVPGAGFGPTPFRDASIGFLPNQSSSGSRMGVFTAKASNLPTYDGERNAEKVITFLVSLERAFLVRAQETMTQGSTTSWGMYAIQQLRGKAAEWGNHEWGLGENIGWEKFRERVTEQFIPPDYVTRVKLEFSNLTINPKKPLTDFNERFRSLRLCLRIVTGTGRQEERDGELIDFYVARIQAAVAQEKGDSMARVYSAYVQWEALRDKKEPLTLATVMNFCARMDNIHNRHSSAGTAPLTTGTTHQPSLTTSQGGDRMDIYAMNNRNQGYRRSSADTKRGRSNEGQSRRASGGKKDEDKEKKKDVDKKDRDMSKVKCFHCGSMGHMKQDCKGYKRMISALEKAEVRVTEDLSEDEEDQEEGN